LKNWQVNMKTILTVTLLLALSTPAMTQQDLSIGSVVKRIGVEASDLSKAAHQDNPQRR
jgi:hypothetical protein